MNRELAESNVVLGLFGSFAYSWFYKLYAPYRLNTGANFNSRLDTVW
jgi:hypothetical protein